MRRLLLAAVAASLVVAAVGLSTTQKQTNGDMQVQVEQRNPWTHLRLNDRDGAFHFAIVSDRTGGHRARIFSQAVEQLNLLQPAFVLSVGDLIEGYSKDTIRVAGEWKEFQSYVNKLQMPFFYVPGNHDVSNLVQENLWQERFGRRYYHFVYRDVLFVVVCSNDPADSKDGGISKEQLAFVQQALKDNASVRWTIVALHQPLWAQNNLKTNGWLEVEEALKGRNYTVFAGHIHRYQKFVRNGMNYYQLATTGGGSRVRGPRYGEFDHFAWVTMNKDGPVIANLLLDGIYGENLQRPISEEEGVPLYNRKPVHPVRGQLLFDGCPVPNAQVAFFPPPDPKTKKASRTADALAEADGTFSLSTYTANDGAPVGEYVVTVSWRPADAQGKAGNNVLPGKYASPATSPLRVQVKAGQNDFVLNLTP